jgi:hypothetical protein
VRKRDDDIMSTWHASMVASMSLVVTCVTSGMVDGHEWSQKGVGIPYDFDCNLNH